MKKEKAFQGNDGKRILMNHDYRGARDAWIQDEDDEEEDQNIFSVSLALSESLFRLLD